jgi:Zn-dependent membrane protease YugP
MGVESSYYSNLVYNSTGMICFYVALAITALASIILRIINKKYSGIDNDKGVTGYEVASKILSSNGLTDIQIGKVSGTLTDYYNNSAKEIRLSESVYGEKTIAAIAVAAHECGHALQYKDGYGPIKVRNTLVPIVNIGNTLGYIAVVISLLASLTSLFWIGIILVSFAIVFQLVTLPCEFNASRRANKV